MINFSPQQQAYIDAPWDQNIYLRACPGGGKTEVIAAKVAQEMKGWQRFPAGMAVLSFSRSATAELQVRIAKARRGNTNAYPHFVGTVDSFILAQIATPLAHLVTGYLGKDGDFSIKVVDESALIFQRTKYAIEGQHIAANRYDWDSASDRYRFRHPVVAVQRRLNAVGLQRYQMEDLEKTKQRFNASGFATYKDVEQLAFHVLSDARFAKRVGLLIDRFPVVIVDECQDLSAEQIAIFSLLAEKGVRFHLVGDLNQAIYGFRNCFPGRVADFIVKIACTEMPLDDNHRSGQSIVDLHGKLVQAGKINGKPDYAASTCYLVEYGKCPTEMLGQFDALAAGHELSVIVARGHGTLARLRGDEIAPGPVQLLAAAIATFEKNSAGSLHAAMTVFSEYLVEHCMDSDTLDREMFFRPVDIGLAESWHRFLSDCLSELVRQGLANQNVTWRQWCASLKKALPSLSSVICPDPTSLRIRISLQAKKHPAPANQGDLQMAEAAPAVVAPRTLRRLATIHEVKGESHDVTMLVSSSQQREQSHWKEWLADPQSEAARLAYVASSRPRHILIWAVKTLSVVDKQRLTALGFQVYLPG